MLRPFRVDDAEAMFETWASDPEVTRWLRWEPHTDVAQSRALLEDWATGYCLPYYYSWAIVLADTGELIGSLGIMPTAEENLPEGWAPGYCIGRKFWGKGYTTEALQAAVDYFFQVVGADTLYCCHAVENEASGRVMQKVGFAYTHDGFYKKMDNTVVPAKYYILQTGGGHREKHKDTCVDIQNKGGQKHE